MNGLLKRIKKRFLALGIYGRIFAAMRRDALRMQPVRVAIKRWNRFKNLDGYPMNGFIRDSTCTRTRTHTRRVYRRNNLQSVSSRVFCHALYRDH